MRELRRSQGGNAIRGWRYSPEYSAAVRCMLSSSAFLMVSDMTLESGSMARRWQTVIIIVNVIISMYGVVVMFFDQSSVYIFCDRTWPGGVCTAQPRLSVPEVAFENLATMAV